MRIPLKFNAATCYCLLLAVGLFYFSYRYPFQWANDMTSATYSATPIIVQVMKYVICLLLVILSFFCVVCNVERIKVSREMYLEAMAVSVFCAAYSFLIVGNQNTLMTFLGVLIMFSMCITLNNHFSFEFLDKLFVLFIWVNLIYEIGQVVLYFSENRLPAIAWANAGIAQVRFGGIFDDPFSLSLFISFLLPYIWYKYYGIKRSVFFYFI